MRFHVVFGLLGLSLVACSSSDDASSGSTRSAVEATDPNAPLRMTYQCKRTYCEWSTDVRDEANHTCRSTCSEMPIPNCGSCSDEDYVCEDWEKTTCYEQAFAPSKPLTTDAAVEAACNRLFDHLDTCPTLAADFSREDCPSLAKTDSARAVAFLDCSSSLACDADYASCDLPSSTLGDEIASTYRAKCADAAFTETQRASYNATGGERTDALVAAAKACVTENACDRIATCLDAWWKLE